MSLLVVLGAGIGAPQANATTGPVAQTRPMVAGEATQGERLYGAKGSWSGSGKLAFRYQWFRCDQMGARCTSLRGATKRRRLLGAEDVGHTLGLTVRATDSRGSTMAASKLIGPIGGAPPLLSSTTQPTITGAAVQGSVLKVAPGTWRPVPKSFTYQWARCSAVGRACAPIPGETAESHTVGAPDLGHALVAIVQARSGPTSQAAFSVATAPATQAVVPGGEEVSGPTISAPPHVAVVVQQGSQLTGAVGSWSGSGTIRYAYQWHRCDAAGAHCSSIRGATKPTYTLVAKDVGKTLGFSVRATDRTGASKAYASLVGPVAGPSAKLVSTGQPTISGTPEEGQTLQVAAGSWSPVAVSVAFQWQRCNPRGRLCIPITGATASTYAVTAADTGHALLAVVRATAGASAQAALSAATPAIVSAPAVGPSSSVLPTVAGTIQQGKQLAGSSGNWMGSGTISYGYQWYRCDAAGARCSSVSGATKATYTLVARDVGQTLGFAVRATDATGTSTAYASLIGPVAAATTSLVSTAQPTVTGAARQGETLAVSAGSWNQAPAPLSYGWQRCNANGRLCVPIQDATASTYAVTAADAGHALLVVVTAQANGVSQATYSVATAVVP